MSDHSWGKNIQSRPHFDRINTGLLWNSKMLWKANIILWLKEKCLKKAEISSDQMNKSLHKVSFSNEWHCCLAAAWPIPFFLLYCLHWCFNKDNVVLKLCSFQSFSKVASECEYAHASLTDLSFDWFSFTVYDRVWGNNAMGAGVCLHHLELHCPHAPPHQEDVAWQNRSQAHTGAFERVHLAATTIRQQRCSVTFMYRPVGLQKVRFEENLKEAPSKAFDSIIYWENMDLFAILDIWTGMDTVTHTHIHTYVSRYPWILVHVVSSNPISKSGVRATWWHHQDGHAGCCAWHGSPGSVHLHRCHPSGRYIPSDIVSALSTKLCHPWRAAAPLSYSGVGGTNACMFLC